MKVDGSAAPGSWVFWFGEDGCVTLGCTWRLVGQAGVLLGCEDHGQVFGLQEPTDVVGLTTSLIGGQVVTDATLRDGTGDLVVQFENGVALESFTDSRGYESCQIRLGAFRCLVVVGGGGVREV